MTSSLLVGRAFWKKSRERILFLSLCVRVVFFGVVSLMFLLHYVALFSRKLPEKLSSCQVHFLEEIFGSELLFFSFCVRLVFFVVVSPMFLIHYVALLSRNLPKKILFLSGSLFGRKFREQTFVFLL